MSIPPLCEECGGVGLRARLSAAEIEVVIAMHRGLPEEDKQTHFSIQHRAEDSKIEVILGMHAKELSESVNPESGGAASSQADSSRKKTGVLASPRCKATCSTGCPG